MDQNNSSTNNTQQLNMIEKIIHKVWVTSHGGKNKNDKEFVKLEKTIKTQFNILNNKYLEAWNLLHKIANKINSSIVIKKYQIDGRDFDLYEQERKLLNVKMEIFYEVENKKDLTEEQLEIMMGRALDQINKIYSQLIELKNNHEEFVKIEIENQKNTIENELKEKYKKNQKKKISTNQKLTITFFIFTSLSLAFLGLTIFFKFFM